MMILVLLLTPAGFAALLASMTRHQTDWFGRRLEPRSSQALRAAGFALLGLGGLAAFGIEAWPGVMTWIGVLTASAALVIVVNCWNTDRRSRR